MSYGQGKEDSLDVLTDYSAYQTLHKVESRDSSCNEENGYLKSKVTNLEHALNISEKANDSTLFVIAEKDHALKNVIVNCEKSLKNKSLWCTVKDAGLMITLPLCIVETFAIYALVKK